MWLKRWKYGAANFIKLLYIPAKQCGDRMSFSVKPYELNDIVQRNNGPTTIHLNTWIQYCHSCPSDSSDNPRKNTIQSSLNDDNSLTTKNEKKRFVFAFISSRYFYSRYVINTRLVYAMYTIIKQKRRS